MHPAVYAPDHPPNAQEHDGGYACGDVGLADPHGFLKRAKDIERQTDRVVTDRDDREAFDGFLQT